MTRPAKAPLLTLEPLIEAVRSGVHSAGWDLSGLQKTTSHEFEGRWKGDSSRSAYLFFHRARGPEWASVDVFLDETSTGLVGNLALVVELGPLGALGDVASLLAKLGRLAEDTLPRGYRTPVSLRFRMEDCPGEASEAGSEVRFKLRIPKAALQAGAAATAALSSATVRAFEALLDGRELRRLVGEL